MNQQKPNSKMPESFAIKLRRIMVVGGAWLLSLIILIVLYVTLRTFLAKYTPQAMENNKKAEQVNAFKSKLTACEKQFAVISKAIDAYRKANQDAFPPNLDALVPQYLPGLDAARCPANKESLYVYTQPKPDDNPEMPILVCENHFEIFDGRPVKVTVKLLKNGELREISDAVIAPEDLNR